jgi:hypothetical protein
VSDCSGVGVGWPGVDDRAEFAQDLWEPRPPPHIVGGERAARSGKSSLAGAAQSLLFIRVRACVLACVGKDAARGGCVLIVALIFSPDSPFARCRHGAALGHTRESLERDGCESRPAPSCLSPPPARRVSLTFTTRPSVYYCLVAGNNTRREYSSLNCRRRHYELSPRTIPLGECSESAAVPIPRELGLPSQSVCL